MDGRAQGEQGRSKRYQKLHALTDNGTMVIGDFLARRAPPRRLACQQAGGQADPAMRGGGERWEYAHEHGLHLARDVHDAQRAKYAAVHMAEKEHRQQRKGRPRMEAQGAAVEFRSHRRARSSAKGIFAALRTRCGNALGCMNGAARRREAGMRAVCYSVNAVNKIKAATSRMSCLSSCGGLRVTGPVPRASSPPLPLAPRSAIFSFLPFPPPLPGRRPLRAYVHAHAKMLRPSAVARPLQPARTARGGASPSPAPPRPARTVFGLIFGPYAEFSPTCGRFVHANGKLHSKAPMFAQFFPKKRFLENVQGRTNGYYCHCPARPTWPL